MEFTHEKILERKLESVKSAIYKDCLQLINWKTREGFYESPGNYTNCSQWEDVSIGYRWICGDSTTRWFKREVEIPQGFIGGDIALELEFGGEGLVKIDGVIQSALTSFVTENEATRTRVLLPKNLRAGDVFEVQVETNLNYMEFAFYRDQGQESIEYQFCRADLVLVHNEIEQYYFDIKTAYDTMKAIENPISPIVDTCTNLPDEITRVFESLTRDSYIYQKILDAVINSITILDVDYGYHELVESIAPARKILKEKLDKIEHSPHALIKFVGQAHIDTAWLWPVKETVRKCGKTMANVLDLMDRYNEFIFTFSQPQLFEYIKDYYPELYERIKQKVKSGQFELVGNTWVEMDANIPSGESLVRQLLYGRAFFIKEFKKYSKVFWMPDVFGYSWALPQIIKKSGMDYFYTSKLISNDTNKFPYSLFMWQGIDGTRIPSYVQQLNYNGRYNPETVETIYNKFGQKDQSDDLLMTFGYGDGGGGPNYEMLETGRRLKSFPGLQKTEIDTSISFFKAIDHLKDQLPLWNDEMYYEFHRGTYTSQARTKMHNRKGELGIRQAELLATIAYDRSGAEYPYEEILEAYKIILRNQFHDIIPGSSIKAVYDDCEIEYKEALGIIQKIQSNAINKLTKPAMGEVTVFNSLSWERRDIIKARLPEGYTDGIIVDEKGDEIPSYAKGDYIEFEAWAPALGSATYRIDSRPAFSDTGIRVRENYMENVFYKILLDSGGNITSIYDKQNLCEVLDQEKTSNLLQIFEDKPCYETAWNIDLEYQNKSWDIIDGEVEVIEKSPTKGVIRVTKKFNLSTIVQDITIYSAIPRIDFKTWVDWQETEKMLKAAFFVNVLSSKATYEIQFGAIERPTHWNTSYDKAKFEVCGHKWADLSEGGYGVSLLNDSKYGYDIKDNRMRITLLRAPINPDPTADRGEQEFCYSLFPHKGDFRHGEVVNAGYELNVPLLAIENHRMIEHEPYGEISDKNVIIDTIKLAEDKDGVIIRVYESGGIRGNTCISLKKSISKVYECNLMEENEKEINTDGTSFNFHIKPYEIKTFRILSSQ